MKTLRYSRQRERIYEFLVSTEEHPTAERIYLELRQEFPELSLGTVYRNLKLLEELGRIRRVTAYDGNERYDAICHDHAHFICQNCGSIRDIPALGAEQLRKDLTLDQGYQIAKMDVIFRGMCPGCSQSGEQLKT